MPYIKKEQRERLEYKVNRLSDSIESKGELTYAIYRLTVDYIAKLGRNYHDISEGISSLCDAEFELRRKILSPYEDEKERENGTISPRINHE